MNKCVNHQAQTECMVLLSLSNCALVHAPCTDVNSDVVAHISLAQSTIGPPSISLKIYDLALNLHRNTRLGTHHNC